MPGHRESCDISHLFTEVLQLCVLHSSFHSPVYLLLPPHSTSDTCKRLTLRYSVQNVGSKYQTIPKDSTFCCCSVVQLCPTCKELECSMDIAPQASLSFTVSLSLLKLMPIDSVMLSNHFTLCHPLLLLPSIIPSIRVFSKESALCIRWPKYWSFSFSISPFNGYSALISFSIDWFDLIAIQGTLKSLLQHHWLKALILLCSAFFMFQL